MPRADGNLGLGSESPGFQPWATSTAPLPPVQNAIHDPEIETFFHAEPIRVAIGTAITFCALWFLVVFILYQLARSVL